MGTNQLLELIQFVGLIKFQLVCWHQRHLKYLFFLGTQSTVARASQDGS